MALQFEDLILGPFRELERVRQGIGRRIPIFVEALNKCDDIDAQSRIIEFVTAVRDGAHFFLLGLRLHPRSGVGLSRAAHSSADTPSHE
jgi:hypothetical protein